MLDEFSNTPMSDIPFPKCDYCVRQRTDEYYCKLLPKGKQGLWMYPCSKIQQLICPRAGRKATLAANQVELHCNIKE